MQQSFEYVNTPKPKCCRNNDDSFEKFSEIVKEKFSNCPENVAMNWSELVRQCNVPGTNKRQIVKEICTKIELLKLRLKTHQNVDLELLGKASWKSRFYSVNADC